MRTIKTLLVVIGCGFIGCLNACTPAQTAAGKTDTVIAAKTVACSAADYQKLIDILDDKTLTGEQKFVKAAFGVGPDVLACLAQAKATTTPYVAAGSGK